MIKKKKNTTLYQTLHQLKRTKGAFSKNVFQVLWNAFVRTVQARNRTRQGKTRKDMYTLYRYRKICVCCYFFTLQHERWTSGDLQCKVNGSTALVNTMAHAHGYRSVRQVRGYIRDGPKVMQYKYVLFIGRVHAVNVKRWKCHRVENEMCWNVNRPKLQRIGQITFDVHTRLSMFVRQYFSDKQIRNIVPENV